MVVVAAAARTASWAVVGLALGVLTLGCSDDETPSPDGSPSASGSAQTPTSDPSPSASSEPTSTASAEPTPTPAAGLLLEEETSQLNAPEGDWERIPDVVTYATAVGRSATTEIISLSDRENFADPLPLDEQVRYHNRSLPEGAIVERQPDVVLDGAPAYYVQWYEKGDKRIQHDIGIDHEGRVISIQMDLDRADPAVSEALVASVLASFRWR